MSIDYFLQITCISFFTVLRTVKGGLSASSKIEIFDKKTKKLEKPRKTGRKILKQRFGFSRVVGENFKKAKKSKKYKTKKAK